MIESRLKPWVEIVALLLGIALGGVSLFQQFKPASILTAEIVQVSAPLPPELESRLRGLPESLQKEILEPSDKASAPVPQATIVAPLVKAIADREVGGLFWPTVIQDDMLVCTVRNNGSQPLEAVQVAFKYWHTAKVLVERPDGQRQSVTTGGVVDLGELRPGSQARVFAWGLVTSITSFGNVTVSHKGGSGEVRELQSVPSLISREGGLWFSYRIAFNLLLAALILFGAFLAIRKTVRTIRARNAIRPGA